MFTNLWYKGSSSVQMHLTVLRCEALSCHFTLVDDYELRMSDGLWTRGRQEIRERTRGGELREGNRLGKNNIKLGLWWVPYGLRGHLPARLNRSESAVSDLGLSTAASLSLFQRGPLTGYHVPTPHLLYRHGSSESLVDGRVAKVSEQIDHYVLGVMIFQ